MTNIIWLAMMSKAATKRPKLYLSIPTIFIACWHWTIRLYLAQSSSNTRGNREKCLQNIINPKIISVLLTPRKVDSEKTFKDVKNKQTNKNQKTKKTTTTHTFTRAWLEHNCVQCKSYNRPKNNTQKLSGQFVWTNQSLPGHWLILSGQPILLQ